MFAVLNQFPPHLLPRDACRESAASWDTSQRSVRDQSKTSQRPVKDQSKISQRPVKDQSKTTTEGKEPKRVQQEMKSRTGFAFSRATALPILFHASLHVPVQYLHSTCTVPVRTCTVPVQYLYVPVQYLYSTCTYLHITCTVPVRTCMCLYSLSHCCCAMAGAEDQVSVNQQVERSKMERDYQSQMATLSEELNRVRQEVMGQEMERWRQTAEATSR